MSSAIPSATSTHPHPDTPWTGPHAKTYASVVQGRNKSPSSGQTHESKASSTRSPKIQTNRRAIRGPIPAASSSVQHMPER